MKNSNKSTPPRCLEGEHWVRSHKRTHVVNGQKVLLPVKGYCRINPEHFENLAKEENISLDLLYYALTVFGEARGENDKSLYAIAWVIRNRARREGKCYKETVTKRKQFSCWLPTDDNYKEFKSPGKNKIADKKAWERIKVIVTEVNNALEKNNPIPGIYNYFSGKPTQKWQKIYFDIPGIPAFHFVRISK
jgi:hypothetical protein